MKNLPTSTKWLFGVLMFAITTMGLYMITNTSRVQDTYSIKDLEYYQIENPEKVLKKYKSFDTKEEADTYITGIINKSANTLNKEETKLFGDNIMTNYVPVNGVTYNETTLYIKYNKFTTSEEDFNILKQYIENDNHYDFKIMYYTNDSTQDYGKFLYEDLKAIQEDRSVDYDRVEVPKAFLIIDGELAKEYNSYSDLELK